jgi:hypothetical protein
MPAPVKTPVTEPKRGQKSKRPPFFFYLPNGYSIYENANELQFALEWLLAREQAWSWVNNKRWDVELVSNFTVEQLRRLRDVNFLDFIDREKLIAQIASCGPFEAGGLIFQH